MPYPAVLAPNGYRGDAFERAIALTRAGPPVNGKPGPRLPMPEADLLAIQATYPLMEAQFKLAATDNTSLISLSSAHFDDLTGLPDIRIELAYPLPDGGVGPALVLFFQELHTKAAFDQCVWDLQFVDANGRRQTWIAGEGWGIDQDVTRTAADAATP